MSFQVVVLAIVGVFLLSCEEQKPDVIYQSVTKTIEAEPKDYDDWMNSEYHPERVFEDWYQWQADGATICNELSKLSPLDLTVFENQIRDPKYKDLIGPCRAALIETLDDYWRKERKTFPTPSSDFKMQLETLSMDDFRREKIVGQIIKPKQVLLSFDDGPHPEYTGKLLKILSQVQAKAVFFVLGSNVERWPELVRKEANEGHSMGSHTHDHVCIAQNRRCRSYNNYGFSQSQAINEIQSGVNSLISVLGWTHPFFRFPYGESSQDLQNYVYEKGFFDFYWSIDSDDWRKQNLNDYYASLISKVEKNQGGSILFHDVQKKTVEVMVPFLKYLHKNKYSILIVKSKPVTKF